MSLPPSYAALVNQRLVGEGTKGKFIAVDWHFFRTCLAHLVEEIYVDEQWYMKTYPDVREAVEKGIVESGRAHYVQHGYYEHRLPYSIKVDEAFYLNAYPDVREAYGDNGFDSAQRHFDTVGFREGRLPCADFRFTPARQHLPATLAA